MAELTGTREGGRNHDAHLVVRHLEHVDFPFGLGTFPRHREFNLDIGFFVPG